MDTARIIPYLHDLGISDIYSSPYFKSRPGSLHGYDIVDPRELNPEIGTMDEYDGMIRALQQHGMGQVLDIVPNHMCITSLQNVWWSDVLENGPGSRFAGFFDVDWNPVKKELRNKILLPFLGDQYGKVLEKQELKLAFEEGRFFLLYFEHRFPIAPKSYGMVLEYRGEELRKRLPEDDPHYVEFLSILTALVHLPHFTERESEKVEERDREKEIVKKRLRSLCAESRTVREFIEENVRLFNGVRGEPGSFDLLDALLAEQPYRLSHWRVAMDEINYRRFFDINQIAAIRMENPFTFRETHSLVFSLIREGKVTGLRVDHPDGLLDPSDYFRRLQEGCFLSLLGADPSAGGAEAGEEPEAVREYREKIAANPRFKPFYIVGEKILTKGERMPEDWPIFSTTGYVFMNSVNGVFIDAANGKAMDALYARFAGTGAAFPDVVYEKKKLIMQVAMASEINTLGHYLSSLAGRDRHTRDFTLNSLTAALVEVIAFFPVYRTYSSGSGVNDTDRKYIELSIVKARRKNPATSASIYDFLRDVLLLKYPPDADDAMRRDWVGFVMKFQQITGPVMAKGLEDTAFYVYNRLVSLNEVGGSPDRFGTPLETFHGQNIERSKFWPHALIATSTHDAKRGEDVRARINVLSEIPDEWRARLVAWRRFNRKKKMQVEGRAVPEPNEEYLFYQTLVGAWPLTLSGGGDHENFTARIKEYMIKALREAKVTTSWINQNMAYEEAFLFFIGEVMKDSPDNHFLRDFREFQERVAQFGMLNSLSQVLLKITCPGVPDFYQGTEMWDLSLVDPDNRRPVEYAVRIAALAEIGGRAREGSLADLAGELLRAKRNGKVKLFLIWRALNYRREHGSLFEEGDYTALETGGKRAYHVCAFARRREDAEALVAVPRFFTRLTGGPEDLPLGGEVWGDSFIALPPGSEGLRYRTVFTGEEVRVREREGASVLYLREVFSRFPAALMERSS